MKHYALGNSRPKGGFILSVTLAAALYVQLFSSLPGEFSMFAGDSLTSNTGWPVTMELAADSPTQVTIEPGESLGDVVISADSSQSQPQTLSAQYKLFGVLPIKGSDITVLPKTKLIPCGNAIGVKMMTQGVMVVGFSDILSGGKEQNPALEAGIALKDVLLEINGEPLDSIEDLSQLVEKYQGQPLQLKVQRGETTFETTLTPITDDTTGTSKIGLWVRDSAAGIGTLTFIEPETGTFGGLGHGICDVDTGQLLPLHQGVIQPATIQSVDKGTQGDPGQLKGIFDNTTELGSLSINSNSGIFGTLSSTSAAQTREPVEIALKQEIQEGKATILSNVEGDTVEEYDIEIIKINKSSSGGRSMLLKVTDPDLLAKTGGIVQGMSGSPILQNGKLVGAVTHVLVDDPTRGYGIFIENMLSNITQTQQEGTTTLCPSSVFLDSNRHKKKK